MGKSRMRIMGSILKGLLCAVALTLLMMVGVAALALGLRIPDGTLTALKPGPVMVLAMDAARKKEIFPVTVV